MIGMKVRGQRKQHKSWHPVSVTTYSLRSNTVVNSGEVACRAFTKGTPFDCNWAVVVVVLGWLIGFSK
jgi:hypothetical protein